MTVAPSPSGFHRRRFFAWPESQLARRAALVAGGVFVWFVLLGVLAGLEASEWGWAARAVLIVAGLTGVAAALSAGVAAAVAVVRGERSLVLVVPLLIGAFWALFVLGEFLFPH